VYATLLSACLHYEQHGKCCSVACEYFQIVCIANTACCMQQCFFLPMLKAAHDMPKSIMVDLVLFEQCCWASLTEECWTPPKTWLASNPSVVIIDWHLQEILTCWDFAGVVDLDQWSKSTPAIFTCRSVALPPSQISPSYPSWFTWIHFHIKNLMIRVFDYHWLQ
jgi:hypothetical protein